MRAEAISGGAGAAQIFGEFEGTLTQAAPAPERCRREPREGGRDASASEGGDLQPCGRRSLEVIDITNKLARMLAPTEAERAIDQLEITAMSQRVSLN